MHAFGIPDDPTIYEAFSWLMAEKASIKQNNSTKQVKHLGK